MPKSAQQAASRHGAAAPAKVPEPALSKQDIFQGIRRFVSFLIIAALVITVVSHTGSISGNIFQYHPIMTACAMVLALPEVMGSVAQMKKGRAGLPRDEIILHHQLSTVVFNVCAIAGILAVEYTKHVNGYPHFISLHGFTGSACGISIIMQMVLGNMLRYVLPHKGGLRPMCKTAHGLLSITICVTGLMCLMGGMLATNAAKEIVPSSSLRAVVGLGAPVFIMWGYMR